MEASPALSVGTLPDDDWLFDMSAPASRRASSPSGPPPAAGCTGSRFSPQDAAPAREPGWQRQPPEGQAGGHRKQEADDVDDILRLLQLGSGGSSKFREQGGNAAAERLLCDAVACGPGSGNTASPWLDELGGSDDDFLISRESHQPAATTCTAAAAAAVQTESAPARDKSWPRISFANTLPPRLPAGEPVRRSKAQLGR